jgi:hypothetical protein
MPVFNVLYLIEHDEDNIKIIDNQTIILYDESESDNGFYCYGTRRYKNETDVSNPKFINYYMVYPAKRLWLLTNFLSLVNNKFLSKMTVEMHQIELSCDEYAGLDFDSLYEKMSRFTELCAYDRVQENKFSIRDKLKMITASVNF